MQGVGHHECGISGDVARGEARTVYWDTSVRVTTGIDHMSWMGSTSQVTNCDWFICETTKGVALVEECLRH